ncbi:MAG TPA: hypothetical protein VII38_07540, partial [Polyangia bacterium]
RPAPQPSVELKTQSSLREQPLRPDQTPVTAPMRTEMRAERPSQPSMPAVAVPRPLAGALSGAEETELDIPAFLRHPARTIE